MSENKYLPSSCPICICTGAKCESAYGDYLHVECPRCGNFRITNSLISTLPGQYPDVRKRIDVFDAIRQKEHENIVLNTYNFDTFWNIKYTSILGDYELDECYAEAIGPAIKEELAADGKLSGVEEEEYTPYPFDAEKISIITKKISLSNVVRRVKRGLIVAAEIQRGENLWNIERKSRLIESLMLKIPLPLFYAAEEKNDKLFIVDGLQRISIIRQYITEEAFKLESLEFLREYEGKEYGDLPENMRIRIDETELDFVIIKPESPQEVQRNIFKRLNTGGMPLTDQEIRHALYYGPVTKILKELVETKEFQLATARSVKDSRMAARELVLRFLAFSMLGIEEYRKNGEMDSFLSDTMQIINRISNDSEQVHADSFGSRKSQNNDIEERNVINNNIEEILKKFTLAMERSFKLFGDYAFRVSTPANKDRLDKLTKVFGSTPMVLSTSKRDARTAIKKSLFEVWSILLGNMTNKQFEALLNNRETLFEKLDCAYKEPSLRRYIGQDSTKVSGVRGRHETIRKIISEVIQE